MLKYFRARATQISSVLGAASYGLAIFADVDPTSLAGVAQAVASLALFHVNEAKAGPPAV